MQKDIKLKFKRLYKLNNRRGFRNLLKIIAIGYIYKTELSNLKNVPENNNFGFRIMNKLDLDIIQKNHVNEVDENKYLDLLSKLNMPKVEGFIVKKGDDICGYFFLAYGISESELEKKYFNVKKMDIFLVIMYLKNIEAKKYNSIVFIKD